MRGLSASPVKPTTGRRLWRRESSAALPNPSIGFRFTCVLTIGFVLLQLVANLSDLKTTSLLSWGAIPAGSLLYALTFTWIDLINEYLGKRRARWLVAISIAANVIVVLWFQLYVALPPATETPATESNQAAIDVVFGAVPRIYLASVVTSLVVDNIDISVYNYLRVRAPALWPSLRSAASNTVSAPLDGLLFVPLAFAGSVSSAVILELIVVSAVYKLVIAYVSIPALFSIRRRLSRSATETTSVQQSRPVS